MAQDTKKVTTLIVDDQASIRALLTKILQQMGSEVIGEAEDGEAALSQYQRLQPHLVLMDINMPRMDGVDALSRIMQHNPNALVIMMTSQNDASVVERCLEIGARNFLLKDNAPEQIQQEIRATWRQYLQDMRGV